MFPAGTPDPEYPNDANETGTRLDGRNLVQEWLSKHQVTDCRILVIQWRPGKGFGPYQLLMSL
jgi:hypothetical protein